MRDSQMLQHGRTVKLSQAVLVASFISLWQQGSDIYNSARLAGVTISHGQLITGACTTITLLIVAVILWRSARALRNIGQLAYVDELTGLPNRRSFDAILSEELKRCAKTGTLAVMYFDLDRFKSVNDSYGHEVGDMVIRAFGGRIKSCLRGPDVIARRSGDEFAALIPGIGDASRLETIAGRIFEAMRKPIRVGSRDIYLGVSIGAHLVDKERVSAAEALRRADFALMQAKEAGRNTFRIFDPHMAEEIRQRGVLESDLRRAVADNQFDVVYQPLFTMTPGKAAGVEALVRWTHPVAGEMPSDKFIPVAEAIGVIGQVGEIVLRRACAEIRDLDGLKLAVNISPSHFVQPEFVEMVTGILVETGFEPGRLELEITESVFLTDASRAADAIARLRGLGIAVALDDFGAGYSSMSYLRQIPLDRIKIDRSFLADLKNHGSSAARLVDVMIELGRSLDMQVTAEGVETLEQLDHVRASGCNEVQGFLLARPMRLDELHRSNLWVQHRPMIEQNNEPDQIGADLKVAV